MEYTDSPISILEAEVEKAIKQAIRNKKRRVAADQKPKPQAKRLNRRDPKPEAIMNDPLILNA